MAGNLAGFAYLAAAVCFIMALRGLGSPESARSGNVLGVIGMIIAIAATALLLCGAVLRGAGHGEALRRTRRALLGALTYTNPSDDPRDSRTYALFIEDGDGGARGRG